jgi:hypothetical protein
MRQKENGQSIVELTLILPFLLLLLVAMVESGFALRDYVMVQSVNREGVRWAVRTPPTGGEPELVALFAGETAEVFDRVKSSANDAGLREEDVSIILTHIYLVDDDNDGTYDRSGVDSYVYPAENGGFVGDSQLDTVALADDNLAKYTQINALRGASGYEALENELVVVELFYRHETLWGMDIVGPFGADWTMYAQSSMRMIGTGRSNP